MAESTCLGGDGLVGPMTYARIWTERQSDIDEHKPSPSSVKYSNYIVYNSDFYPINWNKVVLWSEVAGMRAAKGNYYDYGGRSKETFVYL